MVATEVIVGVLSAMGGCWFGRGIGRMQFSNFSVRLMRSTLSYTVSANGMEKELKITWPDGTGG